ncbi:ATP-grasp domain-containing protein [Alkanindiges illinoisensis]|uniref:ATP-grasp domain-containing protein n=1 Tax=Alkanindiges illinoisensis TaxID=197183 RepID=UPI00047BA6E5|nr:hypothetical protein [Alkanindiges illinoisensis]
MKIAIHHREGSFSDRWITYCEKQGINYKIVNAFDSNIIQQVGDCDAFMWHHHHGQFKDVLTAKHILFALEHAGVKVFPDFNTGWHFDDKVAQKYLLEAIGAPLVPSYVFYDKQEAIDWVNKTSFPKVFKLKGGAGSANVKLIKTKQEARSLIEQAFGKGFSQFDRLTAFRERLRRFKEGKANFVDLLKGFMRLFITTKFAKQQPPEKGYVYFQDFSPNLDSDIRIQMIGGRIFGLKRFVRDGDFRASGSGNFIEFNPENIDIRILKIAQRLNEKIQSSCLTIDFIYINEIPHIVELSYGFPVKFYDNCLGYWDNELNWQEGKFEPQEWMLNDILHKLKINRKNII